MYKKEEFINGMATMQIDSLDKLKSKVKSLRDELKNQEKLKDIYKFCFSFAKEPASRNLQFEMAVGKI